jgi:hypothetical protein
MTDPSPKLPPETDRKKGTLAIRGKDGKFWIMTGVPDNVFDYVERGEDIPIEAFGGV